MVLAFTNIRGWVDPLAPISTRIIETREWNSPPVMVNGDWIEPTEESTAQVSRTPRADLLAARRDIDWGEAPKYNKAYTVIRWPPGEPPRPERRTASIFSNTITTEPATTRHGMPPWKSLLNMDRNKKRNSQWSRDETKARLVMDLTNCMSNNIPFKTKSFEYMPKDQWLYVKGIRALKYDITTGHIVEFTYSGVYNKVTSLLFRYLHIPVKLIKGKPCFIQTNTRLSIYKETFLDLNRIYNYRDFDFPNGFYCVDGALYREYRSSQN